MPSTFLHRSSALFRRAGAVTSGVLLASFALACGKTTDATPRDVAMQLYVSLEAAGVRGMPEPRALPVIEPYLTDSLSMLLRQASTRATTQAATRTNSSDPGPDLSRSVFSGLFDGYSTYHVSDVQMQADTALVIMAFTNTLQKPAVTWNDTLVVVKSPPSWRIHDLRYGGDWEFGYRGTLRHVLTRAGSSTSPDETSATPPAPATNTR